MEAQTRRIDWVLLGGRSFPVEVREEKRGTFVATSPDWRLEVEGESAPEALRELAKELDRRLEAALELSRRDATCMP